MSAVVETAQLAEAIEAQSRLMRKLANEMEESRTAYIAMNLEAIYGHVTAQTELCERLSEADRARAAASQALRAALPAELWTEGNALPDDLNRWFATIDPASAERLRHAITDMALAEGQARHLHRAHAVMLEGSRRTIQMLANALTTFSPFYSAPQGGTPAVEARQA
ncbi:MAG: hypothetical protein ACRD4X_08055 [Candidatus Acidiferrales bacterium]